MASLRHLDGLLNRPCGRFERVQQLLVQAASPPRRHDGGVWRHRLAVLGCLLQLSGAPPGMDAHWRAERFWKDLMTRRDSHEGKLYGS